VGVAFVFVAVAVALVFWPSDPVFPLVAVLWAVGEPPFKAPANPTQEQQLQTMTTIAAATAISI
jgi:hypothetical protein